MVGTRMLFVKRPLGLRPRIVKPIICLFVGLCALGVCTFDLVAQSADVAVPEGVALDLETFYFHNKDTGQVVGFDRGMEALIEYLGPPTSIDEPQDALKEYRWAGGLLIQSVGTNLPLRIVVDSNGPWRTAREVGIGSTREEVLAAYEDFDIPYGNPQSDSSHQVLDRDYVYYWDFTYDYSSGIPGFIDGPQFTALFEFNDQDEVTKMRLSIDYN